MPQFSDLPTKAFLGSTGAAANSYVLINYAENQQNTPVTYKATIEELSKAIVSNKRLIQMNDSDTICTVTVRPSRQTYIADDSHYILTKDEHTFLQDIKEDAPWASTGYVTTAISGLASTGYVTNAVANAGGGSFNPISYQTPNESAALLFVTPSGSIGHYANDNFYMTSNIVDTSTMNDAIGTAINGLVSAGYVTDAISAAAYQEPTSSDEIAAAYKNFFASAGDIESAFTNHESLFLPTHPSEFHVAFIGTSDNKPAIYTANEQFQGFLSTT